MALQQRIKKLTKNGHSKEIESFISKLEQKATLPSALKTKLDEIGNTPILEPEIFKMTQDNEDLVDVLVEIFKKNTKKKQETIEKEIAILSKDLGLEAMVLFAKLAVEKVAQLENEDGSVKSTPNTENCDFPDIFQVRDFNKKQSELKNLFKSYREVKPDTRALEDMSEDEIDEMNSALGELNEKTTAISKELNDMSLEFSGLDLEKLTDWEKQLVSHNINLYMQNAYSKTILGKQ